MQEFEFPRKEQSRSNAHIISVCYHLSSTHVTLLRAGFPLYFDSLSSSPSLAPVIRLWCHSTVETNSHLMLADLFPSPIHSLCPLRNTKVFTKENTKRHNAQICAKSNGQLSMMTCKRVTTLGKHPVPNYINRKLPDHQSLSAELKMGCFLVN